MERYGVTWADGVTDAEIELWMAFDVRGGSPVSLHKASGFKGRFAHLKNAIDLIWNRGSRQALIWNEWTELMLESMIENREWVIAGPSASWKSTCAAVYANCFWFADPLRSKVIISSTTLGGLRERIWKDILSFYKASGVGYGKVIQHPTPKIQTAQGDDGSGIHGVAVEQGDTDKAIDKIKGRHAPNVLVEIDEGTGALPAIVDVCINLETGCERFQLGMLQNPCSYFDQGGRLAEPKDGWASVSVELDRWQTSRGGVCVHLDGLKSPNVLAGAKIYPGLISQSDIDSSAARDGENSPRFWQERRGFWPPEGITKTILFESMIVKFKVRERPVWVGKTLMLGAFDPAFEGGDRRVIGFAKIGQIDDEGDIHSALCFEECFNLKVDVTSKEPMHFQLARQVKEECMKRDVEPRHFAMDVTGEGGGTADILKREWSEDFIQVNFAGRATDRAVSDLNPRKCYEEYANRVSELWYQVRRAVERNQVRGMPVEMATEFCQRNYEMRGMLILAESKKIMKARIGHSPDYGDMGAIMIENAIVNRLLPSDTYTLHGGVKSERWTEWAKKMMPKNRYGIKAA